MMRALLDWVDDRTGWRRIVHESLYENVPGGARWRYITGSMLVFAFVTQAITGIFLWMCYSPGSQNAYESVFWIQNELQGGWLLRGIHHFMAQAMVALLPLHFLQVVIDKAYRGPREFNFWTGLVLMLLTLGLSLTGYLLPWDQKGYWATKVATNLIALAPGGEQLQKLVVGGSDYGHYTLTRFFALHAGVLPALLVMVLMIHLSLFRRHGITAESSPHRPDQYFWPYQVLKDAVGCLLLLAIVLLAAIHFDVQGLIYGTLDGSHVGAHLSAPANPVEDYKAARPEWYFLFLFQFLKKFEDAEFFGAIVVPSLILVYMFLMPLIGRWRAGHALNVTVLLVLIGGAVYLTGEALVEDNYAAWFTPIEDPEKLKEEFGNDEAAIAVYRDKVKSSKDYLAAVEQAHVDYRRVQELVKQHGIPSEGVHALLRVDPETQGPRLFREQCASCHSYLDPEGRGIAGPDASEDGTPNGAPNLYGFASRTWLQGLLDPKGIVSSNYFGRTAHGAKDEAGDYPSGGMVEFVHTNLAELDEEGKKNLQEAIAALSAEAELKYQRAADEEAEKDGTLERGREALVTTFACVDCHKLHDDGALGTAPDLTGYGSLEWLKLMIGNPEHERMYETGNDRMPAFAAHADNPTANLLSAEQIDMLARWIRGDAKPVKE